MTATPDDQQELEKEIEQTREQLGQTVEALAAKVDVKARAQQELGQLTARLKGKATEATRRLRLRTGRTRRSSRRSRPASRSGSAGPGWCDGRRDRRARTVLRPYQTVDAA